MAKDESTRDDIALMRLVYSWCRVMSPVEHIAAVWASMW